MFQYVPLLDGLVSLLKNPEIYSEVGKMIEVTYFSLDRIILGNEITFTFRQLNRGLL